MNEDLNFKEDNSLILTKLLVYFLLNAVGVSTGLYGYLVKSFEKTRLIVAIGSTFYLLATGIWTLILQYYIVGTLYRGRDQNGKSVWLRSSIKYPQGIYRIELLKTSSGQQVSAVEIGVGEWIDLDGGIRADLLVQSLNEKLVPKFKLE